MGSPSKSNVTGDQLDRNYAPPTMPSSSSTAANGVWLGRGHSLGLLRPKRKKRSKHASVKITYSSIGYRNLQIPSFEYLNESQKKN